MALDRRTGEEDREALEALVFGNPDLERLESVLSRFNIFEAVGVVRQELRHSDLLAFLLDPRGNHGLGDLFAKSLLRKALATSDASPLRPPPIDLDRWDLTRMEVRREWRNIDILLLDGVNRLAVIIENKIDTGEHSDQLRRYWEDVADHYPEHRLVGLYLTPDGVQPSHAGYRPVGYRLVCELAEAIAEAEAAPPDGDVRVLLSHYAQLLRRHIVTDSEIAELCRRIYREHRRALVLIYEHRPDPEDGILGPTFRS